MIPTTNNEQARAENACENLNILDATAQIVEDGFRNADVAKLVQMRHYVSSVGKTALLFKLPVPEVRRTTATFAQTSRALLKLDATVDALESTLTDVVESQFPESGICPHVPLGIRPPVRRSTVTHPTRCPALLRDRILAVELWLQVLLEEGSVVHTWNPIVQRARAAVERAKAAATVKELEPVPPTSGFKELEPVPPTSRQFRSRHSLQPGPAPKTAWSCQIDTETKGAFAPL